MSRVAKYAIVGVGQSLLIRPTPPGSIMDSIQAAFPHVPCYNRGIGGASATNLLNGTGPADGKPASKWSIPYMKSALTTIVFLIDGTADIHTELNNAATVYADLWALTDAHRTGGADYVIATTITPASYITGAEETARTGANALILGDASSKFDYKVDLAGVSGLDVAAAPNYVDDGGGVYVHWSTAGMTLAYNAVLPTLQALIPAADR